MANKLKWNNHKSTFFEILKAQRETSKYTDATLAVDGKFYPVHKLVLSTCSEYFSEIFERTACKSPVIVLKDVQSHDIEALLDYIYVGEVDVKQDHLASLLKTANCLRIKGLGVPEEYQTKSHKNSISSHDVAHARPYSPPPKRRKHDSNAALANPNHSPHIPSNTSSNTKQEDESLFVKVEIDDSMEEEVRFIKEDVYEAGVETDHNPGKVSGYDITKKEQEPESYVCTSLPGPSSQQFTSSTSNTKQDEFLVVKVGLEAAKEPDLRVSQKHNYDGATSSDLDPLGGDDGSIIFNTEHNQEYYGSTSLPGSYLQQSASLSCNLVSYEPLPSYQANTTQPRPSTKRKAHGNPDSNREYDQVKRIRAFQHSWLTAFPWLRYDKEKGLMYCQVCRDFKNNIVKGKPSKFILGTDSFRFDPIVYHNNTEPHRQCLIAQKAKERPAETPMS